MNFWAWPLPIFVIWPNYATGAILRNSENTTFFALMGMLISQPSRERSIYKFCVPPLPIFVIWPNYVTSAISRDSETATFFACPIVHANIPVLPGVLLL